MIDHNKPNNFHNYDKVQIGPEGVGNYLESRRVQKVNASKPPCTGQFDANHHQGSIDPEERNKTQRGSSSEVAGIGIDGWVYFAAIWASPIGLIR